MVIVWIALCVVLLAVELHHLAFFAIFGAAGAAAAAVVAGVSPTAVPLQLAVAIAVAGLGVAVGRPYVSRAFALRGNGHHIRGVHGGIVGAHGVTIDEVAEVTGGHVRMLGETWLAVAAPGECIPPATPVVILDVVGTTLTVRAVDEGAFL